MRITESKLRRIIKNILVEQSGGDKGDFDKGIYDAIFQKALNDENFMSQIKEIVEKHYKGENKGNARPLGLQKVIKLFKNYMIEEFEKITSSPFSSVGTVRGAYMRSKVAKFLKAGGFEPKSKSK